MKDLKGNFKVEELEALKNSVYGNPRFRVVMVNLLTNDVVVATTKTDASIGYGITNKKIWIFTYHYTKSGKIIITRGE